MTSSDPPVASLLDGVRVLSLGTFVAGNIGPLLLAELGADVVKVESRDHPEPLRSYESPDVPPVFEPSGIPTTALFAGMTRSMRSCCVDLERAAGREVFGSLVSQADVLIENLRPGKMASWGLSLAELWARHPRLVVVSISGYGRTGPLAGYRAYASNINNHVGLTAAWALDGTHFDFVAGVHAAGAVVAALTEAERASTGVYVDLAQTETAAAIMAPLYLDFLANGREWDAAPNEVPGASLSGVFACRGPDAWVAIELEDGHDWDTLCTYLQRRDLGDAGDAPTPEQREALREAIGKWAVALTPIQAALQLQAIGLAAGPVQNAEDLWRDAQHRSRGSFAAVRHPDLGLVEYPDTPGRRLSLTPGRVRSRGPRLGEHTTALAQEWLGIGATETAALTARGALWQPEGGPPGTGG